jgi:hypothetical protein
MNRGYDKNNLGDILGTLMDYQKYLDLGGGKQFGDQAEVGADNSGPVGPVYSGRMIKLLIRRGKGSL